MSPTSVLSINALGLGLEAFVMVRAALHAGIADARATFELSIVEPSPDFGFFVFAGLEPLLDALERFRTKPEELSWLESLGAIDAATRARLAEMRFTCDVDAAPEGTIFFPGEPVLVVEGPFWQAQLVGGLIESALAESTLVATKFARCTLAASGAEVIEVGAATAHRLGGEPLLARAAYLGGATATSCSLAAKRYGIPVRAAQPSRLARATADEVRAFSAWLEALPHGAVLRIEPHDARTGIEHAIRSVRQRGQREQWEDGGIALELVGGDRGELAREVVRAFAEANLPAPPIIASGALDERRILDIARDGVPIAAYCVSTHVPYDAGTLTRYELVAIEEDGQWMPRVRPGESVYTSSDPGRKIFVRYRDAYGRPVADVAHLTNERLLSAGDEHFVERATGFTMRLDTASSSAPLFKGMMRQGKRVAAPEPVAPIRERVLSGLAALAERHRRLTDPTRFPVGMTPALAELKSELVAAALGGESEIHHMLGRLRG